MTITIMCDYCADGLWKDNIAINIHLLGNYFNIDKNIVDNLSEKIDKWQLTFEKFNLWDPNIDLNNIKNSKLFKDFINEGKIIAKEIKQILPKKVKVIYFDESNNKRYIVTDQLEFIEMTDI